MVVAIAKNREMMMTRMQGQVRNQHQNQNRRSESEKQNSVRASQNVRIPLLFKRNLLVNRVVRRWTSHRGGVRKRDGGRTESTGGYQLVVAMGAHLPRTEDRGAFHLGSWRFDLTPRH